MDELTVVEVVVAVELGQFLLREFVGAEVESVRGPSSKHNSSDSSQWPVSKGKLECAFN
jgi:hypothetical protein